MRSGLSRAEKNEQTRRALLDAARTVFLEQGFHDTSLDTVADRAGLTKGAVYSRFESKADLFLALLAERIEERLAQVRSVLGTGASAGDVSAPERQYHAILRTQLDWTLLVIEFRVHAARHPEINRRYAALHRCFYDALVEAARESAAAGGPSPVRPPEEYIAAALVLGSGSALELAADPSFSLEQVESWSQTLYFGADADRSLVGKES
jgi:AcrR family transcriptional regulator